MSAHPDDDAWIWTAPRTGTPPQPDDARLVIVAFHGGTLDGRALMLHPSITSVTTDSGEVYDVAKLGFYRTGVLR